MTGEKQRIYDILVRRGVIINGVFKPTTFRKIVTEPSLYAKTMQYRFNELNGDVQIETEEIEETSPIETQVADNEPVIEETVEPEVVAEETVEGIEETAVEEPTVETIEETVVEEAGTEETVEAEVVTEEADVVAEEPAVIEETPKKKSKKK